MARGSSSPKGTFERAGGTYPDVPSRRLPSAQERVQQAIELRGLGLSGGWGDSPIKAANRVHAPPRSLARRSVSRANSSLKAAFGILSKAQSYRELRRLQIRAPKVSLFCARRKVRREVLFARRVAGFRNRSPGRGGSYRRTGNSAWRC